MGLFNFVEDAGLTIAGDDNEVKAANLKKMIQDVGFEVKELEIIIDNGKATVTGEAATKEVREKVILMIGNNSGISEVDDKMTIAESDEEEVDQAKFYTVKKGDTLGGIAKEYYGNAMKYKEVFEANKPMLKSADLIYPGQVLRMPDLG